MLIKYYTIDENLHLLSDVSEIQMIKVTPDDFETFGQILDFKEEPDYEKTYPLVRFFQNGFKQFFVSGTCYICADDGKTIEKIVPFNV